MKRPAAGPVCRHQIDTGNAEQEKLEFRRDWRPTHVKQGRDCGQAECDASSENGHRCERVLHNKKWNCSGKYQRQICYRQLQPAMSNLTLDVPNTATARMDESKIALSRSATANSSTAALKPARQRPV